MSHLITYQYLYQNCRFLRRLEKSIKRRHIYHYHHNIDIESRDIDDDENDSDVFRNVTSPLLKSKTYMVNDATHSKILPLKYVTPAESLTATTVRKQHVERTQSLPNSSEYNH